MNITELIKELIEAYKSNQPENPSQAVNSPQQQLMLIVVAVLLGVVTSLAALIFLIAILLLARLGDRPQEITGSRESNLQSSSSPPAIPSPSPSPSPPPSPSPSPSPQSLHQTEAEAMGILEAWFDAKPEIFGRTYKLEPAYRLTTGKLLNTTVSDSVPWLRNNNTYYVYQGYDLTPRSFSSSDGVTEITVSISEQLALHRNGRFIKDGSYRNAVYQYTIIYDTSSESWKMADRKKL